MTDARLIYNAIKTPDGTVIQSRHRYDYKTHTDANGKEYMIDGGLSYVRSSAHDDQVSMALYDNDTPHSSQRLILEWGTYGINGDEGKSYIAVACMETAHILAVLEECNPAYVYAQCMIKELVERGVPAKSPDVEA